jgi:hypothetical protein
MNARTIFLLFVISTATGCAEEQLDPCDIRQPECQQDVFLLLQNIRGDGWNAFTEMPPVNTITQDEYRDMLLESASGDGEPQANPWDAALALLKLIPQETSAAEASADEQVEDVVAFYSSDSKSVSVIDREEMKDPEYAMEILAHEFVHAIQDREIGLSSLMASVDEMFARDAYVEGEAVLYQILFSLAREDISPQIIDWSGMYGRMLDDMRTGVMESDSPFYAVVRLVYPLGAEHLTRLYLRGGNAAIRGAYAIRPTTGVAYMVGPEDYREEGRQLADCAFTEPEGVELYGFTTMGAPVAYAFLTAAGAGDGEAWSAALKWRDDEITVFSDEDGESAALVWCLRFQDDAAADTFIGYISPDDYREIIRRDDQVAIAAATGEETLAAWEPEL